MSRSTNIPIRTLHIAGVIAPGLLGMLLIWPAVPYIWRNAWIDLPLSDWLQSSVLVLAAWLLGEFMSVIGSAIGLSLGFLIGQCLTVWRKWYPRDDAHAARIASIKDMEDRLDAQESARHQAFMRSPMIYNFVSDYLIQKHFPFARKYLYDCRHLVNYKITELLDDNQVLQAAARMNFLNGASGMFSTLAIVYFIGAIFWVDNTPLAFGLAGVMGLASLVFTVAAIIALKDAHTLAYIAAFVKLGEEDPAFLDHVKRIMLAIRIRSDRAPSGTQDLRSCGGEQPLKMCSAEGTQTSVSQAGELKDSMCSSDVG
jgi:hypothetical protein